MSRFASGLGNSLEKWKGKVAVVTGASAGIGASIAESLVTEGMQVVGLARRKEKLNDLAKVLKHELGEFYAVQADLSNENEIKKAFEWIETNLGAIHILVNNAATFEMTTILDGDSSLWEKMLDTNFLSYCMCTKLAIENMEKHKITDGYVININSATGHKIHFSPGLNVYPVSKHQVTALTTAVRHELTAKKSSIKVTSISPGLVHTEILSNTGIENIVFSTYHLDVQDVADAVVYALSTPPYVEINEIMIKPLGENI